MSNASTTHLIGTALLAGLLGGLQSAVAQERAGRAEAPLFERLGGLAPISVVVDDFIDALAPDPVLNENAALAEARRHVPAPYLKYHVTAMVCEATGGPCAYHGRGMREAHAHLNISESEWDRMMTLFHGVLDEHAVPDRETSELVAIVEATRPEIVTADR